MNMNVVWDKMYRWDVCSLAWKLITVHISCLYFHFLLGVASDYYFFFFHAYAHESIV